MYFQVCSNSAYTQHSGERYRTNGPLVFLLTRVCSFLFTTFHHAVCDHQIMSSMQSGYDVSVL